MRNLILLDLAVLAIAAISCALPSYAGGETRNGGDAYAQAFIAQALDLASLLDAHPEVSTLGLDPKALRTALQSTRVTSADSLILNGFEVDAINYPDENRIEISKKNWDRLMAMPTRRTLLALHEYLGVLKIEQNHYDVSIAIGKALHLDLESASVPLPAPAPRPSNVPDGYVQWANGGGWVSPAAQIDPSAFIDSKSQVGPKMWVTANVVIRGSILEACGPNSTNEIEHDSVITDSILRGSYLIEDGAIIQGSTLSNLEDCRNEFEINSNAVILKSTIRGGIEVSNNAKVSGSELIGNFEIEDGAIIQHSHLEGKILVESRAIVDNSTVVGTEYIEINYDAVVRNSTLTGKGIEICDRATIISSTLQNTADHIQVRSDAFVRASTLTHGTFAEGAIVDHVNH